MLKLFCAAEFSGMVNSSEFCVAESDAMPTPAPGVRVPKLSSTRSSPSERLSLTMLTVMRPVVLPAAILSVPLLLRRSGFWAVFGPPRASPVFAWFCTAALQATSTGPALAPLSVTSKAASVPSRICNPGAASLESVPATAARLSVMASSSVMVACALRAATAPSTTPPVVLVSVRISVSAASFSASSLSGSEMLPPLSPLLKLSVPLALVWPLGQV